MRAIRSLSPLVPQRLGHAERGVGDRGNPLSGKFEDSPRQTTGLSLIRGKTTTGEEVDLGFQTRGAYYPLLGLQTCGRELIVKTQRYYTNRRRIHPCHQHFRVQNPQSHNNTILRPCRNVFFLNK